MKYLVAGRQPWNRRHFEELLAPLGEAWSFCATPDELTAALEADAEFRFIFFLHWSEKIPATVLDRHECVCFHMTDVPYGRGGSPLQNLIARGHRETVLTALRMTERFDAGPVYLKVPLSLEGGSAEEIFQRASRRSCELALRLAREEPAAEEQEGDEVVFRRRRPTESEMPADAANELEVFDHIRMLDAEGYPKAFVEVGNLRLEFSRAALYHDGIQADVRITLKTDEEQ